MKHRKRVTAIIFAALGVMLITLAAFGFEENAGNTNEQAIDDFQPGNSDLNILNGGTLVQIDNEMYYAEDNGIFRESGDDTELLTQDCAENLNIVDDTLYYTENDESGGHIKRLDIQSNETTGILSLDSEIDQMYLVNSLSAYYLTEGSIYSVDVESGDVGQVQDGGDVFSFAPTEYGIVCAKGELFDLDIYAGDTLVAQGATTYYTEEGQLLITTEGEQLQASIEESFQGEAELAEVSIYETVDLSEVLLEEEECEICQQNYQELVSGKISLAEYTIDSGEGHGTDGEHIQLMSSNQSNIVLRARQQAEILWTPLKTVYGWNDQYTFNAGQTYQGIPYGQPIYSGAYVPNTASFSTFISAVNNPSSSFYSARSAYLKQSTFYASDCSSFVSWAWGIARNTTATLGARATAIGNWSVGSFQIGDALNSNYAGHVVLIKSVEYNSSGAVAAVEIVEQTPPICKSTRYGEGGSATLAALTSRFSGYTLLRYTGTVTYTADSAVPLTSGASQFSDVRASDWFCEAVNYVAGRGIFNGTSTTTFSPYSQMSRGQLVTVLGRMSGVNSDNYCYTGTIRGTGVNFRSSPTTASSSNILGILNTGNRVTVLEHSGEWYKVIYNGTTGYVFDLYVNVGGGTFSDVAAGMYYTGYIQWAAKAGLIDGYSSTTFGPEDPLTREQMAKILCRYASYCGKTLSNSVAEISFTDSGSVSDYAKGYVKQLQMSGIIAGFEDGSFRPQASISRAETATMLMRYHQKYA